MDTSVADRSEALLGKLPFSSLSKQQFHNWIAASDYINKFRLTAERTEQYEFYIRNSKAPALT